MQDPLIPEPALVRPTRPVGDVLAPLTPLAPPIVIPAGAGQEPAALAVLRGIARRWRWVVAVGLSAAVVVGFSIWFLLPPPTPGATARLYVPIKPTTMLGGDHPDPPLDRQTQVALVKSQLVLNTALNTGNVASQPILKAQDDPLDWIAKKIAVDFIEGPEILRISLTNDDPEQARIIVNAVKDAYFHEIVERSVTDRADRLHKLEVMLGQAEDTLKRKQAQVRKVVEEKDVDGDEKATAQRQLFAQEHYDIAKKELLKVETELRRLRSEEMALKGRAAGGGAGAELPDPVLEKYVDEDPRIRDAEANRRKLEDDYEKLKVAASHPEQTAPGQRIIAQLKAYSKDHAALRAKVKAEIKQRSSQATGTDTNLRLAIIQEQIRFQMDFEKDLIQEVERLGKSVKSIRTNALDMAPQQLEIKNAEGLVGRIHSAVTTLKLEQEIPPRVLKLEDAVINRGDPEKRRMLMALSGAGVAFAIVLAIIGFTEYRLRRVDSPDAVTAGLGLRVVGTVPKPPFRWTTRTVADEEHFERWVSESISCTRTMLMHADGLASHRVIQITSPVAGEGKTTLSTRLATSVAQTGRRTLLVDGDLRNPTAHHRFNLSIGPGLCEVLRGEVSIQDVVRETPVSGLMMITAGRWKDETALALVSSELDGLYAAWRSQFDFVIVDSSPILPVTDPLLLALHADGVLVSLMQGVSRMPQATEAFKRMTALGVRVLGAVVNGTAVRGYGYSASYFPKS